MNGQNSGLNYKCAERFDYEKYKPRQTVQGEARGFIVGVIEWDVERGKYITPSIGF